MTLFTLTIKGRVSKHSCSSFAMGSFTLNCKGLSLEMWSYMRGGCLWQRVHLH